MLCYGDVEYMLSVSDNLVVKGLAYLATMIQLSVTNHWSPCQKQGHLVPHHASSSCHVSPMKWRRNGYLSCCGEYFYFLSVRKISIITAASCLWLYSTSVVQQSRQCNCYYCYIIIIIIINIIVIILFSILLYIFLLGLHSFTIVMFKQATLVFLWMAWKTTTSFCWIWRYLAEQWQLFLSVAHSACVYFIDLTSAR